MAVVRFVYESCAIRVSHRLPSQAHLPSTGIRSRNMIHRKIFPALLMLVAMCFFAQEMLTNESILKLCKAGVGDDTIVDMIKAQPSKFSLRTDDIIALKSAGITEKVIAAMVAKGAGAITAKADPARSDPPSLTQNGI